MNFALALSIAVSFWGARGAPVSCHPVAVPGSYADLILPKDQWGFPAAMGAVPGTCTIYISSAATTYRHDRIMRATYCMDVVHEVGHIVGKPHSADPTSIMYRDADDRYAPWDCWHWRSYAKRHHIPLGR
jgi:hypothetical protein